LFCTMAASLGVLLAAWSLHAVEGTLANQFATTTTFSLDPLTLLFTVVISALSSLAIGLVPALQSTTLNLADVLKDSARGTVGGARGTKFRGLLIVSEVSLSVVLLIGSTLLLVSFAKLQSTPAGFSARGVASAFVNPSPQHYPTQAEKADFYNHVLDKLRSYPQVTLAAVVQTLPLATTGARYTYTIFGRTVAPLAERPLAYLDLASEDYFAMLKIPLMRGRFFSSTDIANAPLVCIINESFARRLFPNEEAIGHYVVIGQQADIKMEIVGVVGDVKSIGLNVPPPETMYRPVRQSIVGGQNILASTDGNANTMQALLRSAIASVDKSEAMSGFTTLETQVQQSVGVQRVTAWLTGAFAGVALLLSVLGLYSVLAYSVTQRTGEIGIRLALGADRANVVRLVLWQGMRLVTIGLVIGLAVSAVGSRALRSLLFNVEPLNLTVFAGVTILFAVVAILACLVPSWRASRIQALVVLRTD
jgi:predicted permease